MEDILQEFKKQGTLTLDPNIDPESPNPAFPRLHPCDRLGVRTVDMGVPTVYFGKGVKDRARVKGSPPKIEVTMQMPVRFVSMGRGKFGTAVLWPGEDCYFRLVTPVVKKKGESAILILNPQKEVVWIQPFEEQVGDVIRGGVAVVLRKDRPLVVEWKSGDVQGKLKISPEGEFTSLTDTPKEG